MSTTPQRLGKYELRTLLGSGSIGEVWKGYDYQARRDVALKLVHPDLQADPDFMASFLKEGNALCALSHPHLVQVREVNIFRSPDKGNATPYIQMDYIEGQSLTNYLQTTSRTGDFSSIADIVYLFNCLGAAVDYLHSQGFVHGNMKPSNILLNKRETLILTMGEPMLSDVSVVHRAGDREGTPFTASSASSSAYISPEQAKGKPATPYSDTYTMGIILYELCTGVLPFHAESNVAMMMHHINTLPTPPILINSNIPTALSEVILRAIAKEPTTRYPTASLLAAEIAEACLIPPLNTSRSVFDMGSDTGKTGKGPVYLPPQQTMSNEPILGVSSQPLPRITAKFDAFPDKRPSMPLSQDMPTSTLPSTKNNGTTGPRFPVPIELPTPSSKISTALSPVTTGRLPMLAPSTSSAKLPIPPKSRAERWLSPSPLSAAILALVLLLIVVGALGIGLLLHSSGTSTPVGVASTPAVGHVFFRDDALGHDDILSIEIPHVAPPAVKKQYDAWIDYTNGNTTLLGPLTVQNDTAVLMYGGDGSHMNLLANLRRVFVTLENAGGTPAAPSLNTMVYQAGPAPESFQYIQNLLSPSSGSSTNTSLMVGLFETIKSMNDKAGSIVDSVQITHDYPLAVRQATRIIEMIDGTNYARTSGDLPAHLPSLLTVPVGLLSSTRITGYLDLIEAQIQKIEQTAGKNCELLQHAKNVDNAVVDLRDWLQQLRTYDVQLLQAKNLNTPDSINAGLQVKQLAQDAYTGRTIPPNDGPLPISGSAGVYQGYVEAQYMATLDFVKGK